MKTTYTKDSTHFFKTTTKDESVYVRIGVRRQIGIISTILTQHENIQPSTQEEFEEAYNEVNDILRYAAMGTTADAEKQQKRIEKASNYLVPGSEEYDSIEYQIKLIEAAYKESPNDSVMLFDIDGVVEWQKIEGTLTAKEFLDLIG